MRYRVLLLVLFLLPCLALPAQAAGILFGRKKEKVDPKTRVPELISILKTDKDADKRARAAEELRNYEGAHHPEIIPALIDALQADAKPNVRNEAAQSLGKLRPISQAGGEALENATANDSSMRVRLQARNSLLHYHWAGYRSGKKTDVPPLTPQPDGTKEPPAVVTTPVAPPKTIVLPVPAPVNKPPSKALTPPVPSSKEPPLAPPPAAPTTPPPAEVSGPELP